ALPRLRASAAVDAARRRCGGLGRTAEQRETGLRLTVDGRERAADGEVRVGAVESERVHADVGIGGGVPGQDRAGYGIDRREVIPLRPGALVAGVRGRGTDV